MVAATRGSTKRSNPFGDGKILTKKPRTNKTKVVQDQAKQLQQAKLMHVEQTHSQLMQGAVTQQEKKKAEQITAEHALALQPPQEHDWFAQGVMQMQPEGTLVQQPPATLSHASHTEEGLTYGTREAVDNVYTLYTVGLGLWCVYLWNREAFNIRAWFVLALLHTVFLYNDDSDGGGVPCFK
eukprot:494975-Rhodomonas_salina.1